jgi:hypothetical protein
VTLSALEAVRVITALGVAVKLAAEYAETSQAQPLGIIHDGNDAIVGLAAAVASAAPRAAPAGRKGLLLGWTSLNHALWRSGTLHSI